MKEDKIKILSTYIKSGISPILMEDVSTKIFDDAIIIDSNCDRAQLNGHYEGTNYVAPEWYNELVKKSKEPYSILVISQINKIPTNDQIKFGEILKYKKVSTFQLPKNCIIIVTVSNLNNNPINESVYSLLAHV